MPHTLTKNKLILNLAQRIWKYAVENLCIISIHGTKVWIFKRDACNQPAY